jgi:amino acid transporter
MSNNEPSGAAIGWSVFAAYMLMMMGIFQALAGIAGIANDDRFLVTEDYVVKLDVTQWGWVHLIIGIVVFLSGLGIFSGNVLARTVGVFVAIGSAVRAFVYLPLQPVWSSILIAIAVTVIWALTAHGRDITAGT